MELDLYFNMYFIFHALLARQSYCHAEWATCDLLREVPQLGKQLIVIGLHVLSFLPLFGIHARI